MATKKSNARHVLLANKSYGLYIGEIVDNGELAADGTRSIQVTNCRHVAHWRGKTGGITSLAAFGPCGPQAALSRVGAPTPSSVLGGIVNIFDLTPVAVAAFAAIVPTDG